MDIRDLKVFQMIAFEKSVSKAAKKLAVHDTAGSQ